MKCRNDNNIVTLMYLSMILALKRGWYNTCGKKLSIHMEPDNIHRDSRNARYDIRSNFNVINLEIRSDFKVIN